MNTTKEDTTLQQTGQMLDTVTAYHEAGHAWAYWQARKPLRYVTIRPKAGGGRPGHGRCQVWKPRRTNIVQNAWIAAAGPVAEAIWSQSNDPDDDITFADHLTGVFLLTGTAGVADSLGMLDSAPFVEVLRSGLLSDWVGITALAERLVAEKTVSGHMAFELLESKR